MKKYRHAVGQGEAGDNGNGLFRRVLITCVKVTSFFPRSIFNKYTVINFKWFFRRRCTSVLLQAARSPQESVLFLVRSRPGSRVFLSFFPGFLSYFWQQFPSLTLCTSSFTRICTTIYGGWFPQLQVICCLRLSPLVKTKS